MRLATNLRLNVNDPREFTIENLKKVIASVDDRYHSQYQVTEDGYFIVSREYSHNGKGIAFWFDTNSAWCGYAGVKAARKELWVNRIYDAVKKHWPNPKSKHIDVF